MRKKMTLSSRTARSYALPSGVAGLVGLLGMIGLGAVQQPLADQTPQARVALDDVGPDVLPELVVDLDNRLSDVQVADLARRYGSVQLEPTSVHSRSERVYRLKLAEQGPGTMERLHGLLVALRRDARIEAADLSYVYRIPESAATALTDEQDEALPLRPSKEQPVRERPRFLPNDPRYRYQWHLDQMRMPEAWNMGQGEGIIVAVIDTGVTQVEDLGGTEFVPGWNFVDNTADARDDHGHGTHVAGTIAQTTNNGIGVAGVAYRAKIMPIKVLSASGSGSVAGIADGIRFAADHGARVINMSLGGPFNSQVLAKAVRYAVDRGVVVVCAAGNDGRGKVSFPAANSGALAVAATQFDETTTFYSNWGREIAVAAPGGNTRVDQNNDGVPDGVLQHTVTPGNVAKQDYLLFMGTSMASPHVAGVAALLLGAGAKDPAQVRKILESTARKPASYHGNRDPHYGAGIVDASAALAALQSAHSTAPVPPTTPSPLGLGAVLGLTLLALALSRRGMPALMPRA